MYYPQLICFSHNCFSRSKLSNLQQRKLKSPKNQMFEHKSTTIFNKGCENRLLTETYIIGHGTSSRDWVSCVTACTLLEVLSLCCSFRPGNATNIVSMCVSVLGVTQTEAPHQCFCAHSSTQHTAWEKG